jgi:ABC-2 type transport system ATP-binding protein
VAGHGPLGWLTGLDLAATTPMARQIDAGRLAVEVTALTKAYGRNVAVNELDLRVHTGEVFALLGPNGAGKTTTVEVLEGFRAATSGEVKVLGANPASGSRELLDRVGIVPQGLGTFDDLTVHEVVRHFADFYSQPLAPDEVIDMVGLQEKRDALCRSMSGGQRRRVDVALALVGDPELIFLDEPTTGLDPEARRLAWDLVDRLASQGKTTLLTTHYLEEAEFLADRIGIIVRGEMVALGTPETVGGRDAERALISFDRGGALAGAGLPRFPAGTDIVESGDRVVIAASEPTVTTLSLINWASSYDVSELPGFTVQRPTLEQTYLRLIHDSERVDAA